MGTEEGRSGFARGFSLGWGEWVVGGEFEEGRLGAGLGVGVDEGGSGAVDAFEVLEGAVVGVGLEDVGDF